MANTNQNRLVVGPNQDTTFRVLNFDLLTPNVVGTTASIQPKAYYSVLNMGVLTGNINITSGTQTPQICDELVVLASTTATYSITFDSSMFKVSTSNTVSLGTNKSARVSFIYDGTNWIGHGFTA